ncbi:MAG TPA: CDP-alcohol phosphatidyltransferase family protein, partial [Ktedonobacterales bacterium]|nr:CDP-alcohol phosphatidyltransferase family protein [Ktedonobacterales bacterium]
MFGPGLQQSARRIAEKIVRPLAALGLTPNMATFLGLLLNSAAAVILATVNLRIGGVMLLFAGAFDMVDGALARVRNQKTTFGAFFDSTLDRLSEGIVLLGVIVYALRQTHPLPHTIWLVSLTYVAGLGSLMVSYTRARAEGLGLECKSGLMARPERVLLLAAGLILGGASWLLWTIAILAVTSTFTSVQRIFVVWRTLAKAQPTPANTTARTSPLGDGAGAANGRSADSAANNDEQRDQARSQR